ncbi:FUSC family protein [Pelistega suis]|uniref:FUSC family protein n=1 Tax=Pelistega suis TaxID=1631957 RepID=A0A849P588_9BURK|nr:FUSC family membrane protein [Pelistega suis]NOL51183.1 FUSC family protein [Pelistega suis]
MYISTGKFNRIISGPHPFFALRQGIGVLLPIIILIGFLKEYHFGFAFSAGALAIAIIDQPGGTKRFRIKEMLFGLIAGNLAVLITGLTRPFPSIIWVVIAAQVFLFSMLSVFGKRGGIVGFACLLMMLLSLSLDAQGTDIFFYSLITLAGSTYYFLFSITISHFFRLHEERLTLASAVYATADYMRARAAFYDINNDLDTCFRKLLPYMITMTDAHQAARDNVLRNLPEDHKDHQRQRIVLWNVFIEMIALLDTMVATQTDYEVLRQRFQNHDVMLFMRDTLIKLSRTLQRCALKLAHNSSVNYRNSVKAELRAIEYELERFKAEGIVKDEPEIYALVVQVLRRLRNAARYVDIIADNLREGEVKPLDALRRDKSLLQFRTHQSLRLQPILDNMHMGSAIFRYALRVTLAITIVQAITNTIIIFYPDNALVSKLITHSHWVTITILLTMRPGFALTRQRTMMRLQGTVVGCLLTLGLFSISGNAIFLTVTMLIAMILGQALIVNHFRSGSMFITIYVLIGFHFISPDIFTIIGERALDTVIASIIAFACSFAFPWWEENQIIKLAERTIQASQQYLQKELMFIDSVLTKGMGGDNYSAATFAHNPLYIDLQLARRDIHNAYAAFADSYARMLSEPKSHHINIGSLNRLIMSLNTMTSQINSLGPLLVALKTLGPDLSKQFDYILTLLEPPSPETIIPEPPAHLDNTPENQPFMLPVKQMQKAAQTIRQEIQVLKND